MKEGADMISGLTAGKLASAAGTLLFKITAPGMESGKKNAAAKKSAALLMAFIAAAAVFAVSAVRVSAVTIGTVPDSSAFVPTGYTFTTGYRNAEWTIKEEYKSSITVLDKRSGEGCISFVVAKNNSSAKTYTNPLTVTYKNAGSINGRSVDIKMNVDKLVQTGSTNTNVVNCDGEFLCLWGAVTDVSSYKTTGTRYKLTHTTDLSYTITYSDDGQLVQFPCFQAVIDLDTFQNVASVAEGFVPVSGYNTAYLYSGSVLKQQSGGFFAPSQLETDGTDMYTKTGLYITTDNGKFTGRFYGTNCRTQLLIYNQYRAGMLPKPELYIDNSHVYEPGENVVINVKQKIGTLFVDTVTRYTQLGISDDVPEGLLYKSARVCDSSGNDVTDKGTLSYDESSKTVSFEFSADFVKAQSSYDGSEYTLEITTEAQNPDGGSAVITDTAKSTISGIEQVTNEQSVRVAVPYHVTYNYVSGSEGRSLPQEINVSKGDFMISDSGTYYQGDEAVRKESPAEGAKFEIRDDDGNSKGAWVLSWDAEKKQVENQDIVFTGTWSYVPVPRMVIEKKLAADDDEFTAAHGEPVFLFRITGSDSGKSWYRAIVFTEEAVKAAESGETYEDSEGVTFTLDNGFIHAKYAPFSLPEDDYEVEELETLRFVNASAESRYCGDAAVEVDSGTCTADAPLRMSSYKPGDKGFGADYISVCFENAKEDWGRLSHTDVVINKLKEAK